MRAQRLGAAGGRADGAGGPGERLIVLEADEDLGGTWYRNRYPGARFDSESYTYGYSFSKELLDEWHWKEHFSSQPDTATHRAGSPAEASTHAAAAHES